MPSLQNEDRYLRLLEPYQKRVKGVEDRKVFDQFFDKRTLMNIYELMNDGIISTIDFPVSTGKEGGVFKCTSAEGKPLALKIYRITNSTFKALAVYIAGDERFRGITGNFSKTISMWVQREYVNLERYTSYGLPVPFPIARLGNLLAMEYLGTEEGPAPLLKDYPLTQDEANSFYRIVLDFIIRSYTEVGLVHSDLSQYNIMVHNGRPYIIDCSQGVTARHPNARDYLRRDLTNVNKFFRLKGVEVTSTESVMARLSGVV